MDEETILKAINTLEERRDIMIRDYAEGNLTVPFGSVSTVQADIEALHSILPREEEDDGEYEEPTGADGEEYDDVQ